jgi:fermentation-respiration switch protein FrsA (DUF1100 family)
MARMMFRMMLYIFLFFAACFLFLRYFERQTLFVPCRDITDTPGSVGLDHQDVSLKTEDGAVIRGWFVPVVGQRSGALYFLHGNGGNLSHRVNKIRFFHDMGFDVFVIDYRGYGRSTGRPTEAGLYRDASTGYDYLEKKRDLSLPLVVFGESLGSAVAIDLASKKKCDALIVEGAFTSMMDMARRLVPLVPSWALAYKFDSIDKIQKLDVPTLFIHSRNDEIVPFEFGKRLFEASVASKKEFVELTGGHNEAFCAHLDKMRQDIGNFL